MATLAPHIPGSCCCLSTDTAPWSNADEAAHLSDPQISIQGYGDTGASRRFRELPWAWSISRIGRCLGKQLAQHLYSTQTASNMPGQGHPQLLDMCPDRDSITFQDSTKKSLKLWRQAMCRWQEEHSAWMGSVCCRMAECTYADDPSSSLCSWKWRDHESVANLFCKFRIS